MKKLLVYWILLVLLLTSACGSGPEATPTPTKTPASSAAVESPATPTPPPAPAADTGSAANNAPAVDAQPTAAGVPAPAQETVTINAELVNIRGGSSTNDAIVTTAAQGQQFALLGRSADGQWVQVGQNGTALGWIATEFVTIGTGATAAPNTPATDSGSTATTPTQAPAASGPALASNMLSPDFGAQAFLWWKQEVADRDLKWRL